MSKYFEEVCRAMRYISNQEKSIFIGQAVAVGGGVMRNTLLDVPSEKLLEFPVDEDFQMGFSIGMALTGVIPISIFPRWNFVLLATNQIVNHLDKLKEITNLSNPPKVIIRTGIGSVNPLHPGPQHTGDFTDAFKLMCPNINIERLDSSDQIFNAYKKAFDRKDGVSTLLIEQMDMYNA